MLIEIGAHIRKNRENRHITQQQLAQALGMSRTTLQIEKGTGEIGSKAYPGPGISELEIRVRPAGKPPTLDEPR
jgi:transcriptional regulator with XRE-family HTH domain